MGIFNPSPRTGRTQYGKLIWVVGHTGMERKESTDQIAEVGSEKSPAGPELACGFPRSAEKQVVKD
jgi:hypothetical protein